VEYAYDVYDRRIAKTIDLDGVGSAPAQTERFVYDGEHIVLVFDENGVQSDRYLYGIETDQILADEKRSGEVQWTLTDNQGSVRDVVVVDSDGDLINHVTYDSFGNITAQTNPTAYFRFGYTGREVDTETGLMYYRSRYFDSTNGLFISEDAIGFLAGDVNLYRYVLNSPLNFVDPSGHNFEDFINRVDQGVGGFASGATGGLTDIVREGIYGKGVNDNQHGLLHDVSSGLGDLASNAVGGAAAKNGSKLLKYGAGFVRRANDVADKYEKGKSAYDIARGCGDWEDWKNVAGGVAPLGKNARGNGQGASPALGATPINRKQVGSYTNTHESGKTYSGKGNRARSQKSGRRIARTHSDPHVATDFTEAANDREAFKQESRRIDANGGIDSPSNYNITESPGRNFRIEDGEL
jgi:RHS repeat-associated protein